MLAEREILIPRVPLTVEPLFYRPPTIHMDLHRSTYRMEALVDPSSTA